MAWWRSEICSVMVTSDLGTNRTSNDVRSSVAIGRKADMAFAQADF